MRGFISHRKDRRARVAGAVAAALARAVYCQSVMADISNGNLVLTFSQPIVALPTWSAAMLTVSNNGTAKTDSAWVLTTETTVTVTITEVMVAGQITVTFGSAASAIQFVGNLGIAGQTAGGGVVA